MMTMLRDGNPGLSRRFRSEDAFKFADYNDEELTTIMMDRSLKVHLHLTKELAQNVVSNVLAKQRAKPNSAMPVLSIMYWMRRYLNIYIYIYIYIYVYIYTYIYIFIYICIYIHTNIYCICIWIYVYIYIYKCIHRDNREKKGRFVLISTDFYQEAVPNAALNALDSLVNTEHIRTHLTLQQKRVKRQQRGGGDLKKFMKNNVFTGSPGTGKTVYQSVP
jgi:Cdc6-like AAA superfamily ATPase